VLLEGDVFVPGGFVAVVHGGEEGFAVVDGGVLRGGDVWKRERRGEEGDAEEGDESCVVARCVVAR